MTTSEHAATKRTATVAGQQIAYLEAGDPHGHALVLLHGFPGSSATFSTLIERLPRHLRIIAPDYPGFGSSDLLPAGTAATFDGLAAATGALLDTLGIASFDLYMFDFGGPVGMRIAQDRPASVTGLIFQNANIYSDGLGPGFAGLKGYWADPDGFRPKLRGALLGFNGVRGQHLAGVASADDIPASLYQSAARELEDPARQEAVLDLLLDYQHNLLRYPQWQQWLRDTDVPVLAVWGRNDPIFNEAGATGLQADAQELTTELLDAGHFAAAERPDDVAAAVAAFLGERSEEPR